MVRLVVRGARVDEMVPMIARSWPVMMAGWDGHSVVAWRVAGGGLVVLGFVWLHRVKAIWF